MQNLINPLEKPALVLPVATNVPMTPVAEVAQPQVQATATVPQAPAGVSCSLNASIKLVTTAKIEMPWGFVSDVYQYAFITPMGELCLSDLPPSLLRNPENAALDQWRALPTAKLIVVGSISDTEHWRESLTMRPDDEDVEEEVEEEEEVLLEEQPIFNDAQLSQLSRKQFARHMAKMRSEGRNKYGLKVDE